MDADPRIVWRDGQPILLDLFDLPHTATDLQAAIRKLETQRELIAASADVIESAIAQRRAWLHELQAREGAAVYAR